MMARRWHFKGEKRVIPNYVISLMAASKCLRKGCQAYLAFVIKSGKESPKLNSIPIVKEFLYVFLEELSGLPLEKKSGGDY